MASDEQRPSVKKLLMAPFMSGMTALLLLIGAGLYAQYVNYYDRQLSASRLSSLKLYQASVRDHHTIMGSLLEVIAADSRLLPFFESRNAEAMEKLYSATFEELRKNHQIASLVFIDPLKCVITDLERPENRNALVNRFIFSEADRSGSTVIGLDVGSAGGLTMRMVRPVFRYNVLIGYIEAAIDFSHVAHFMSESESANMLFVLNHSVITEELLPKGPARADSPGLWIDTGGEAIVYSSVTSLDAAFVQALLRKRQQSAPDAKDTYFTLAFGRDYYVTGRFPLTDSLGSSLGELLIVEKATSMWYEYLFTAIGLLGVGLVIILICRHLVSAKLDSTDIHITGMVRELSKRELIFENVFKESETGFVLQNWTTGEILRANQVALSIFDVEEAAKLRLADMRPMDPEHPLRASWEASGAQTPLMHVVTPKGVAYCELNHFFLGDNEEVQCVTIRDVTRLVLLQNENLSQISYLQDIIDQLPAMVFIKDHSSRLTLYNAVFDQVFGEGGSMIGKIYFADWLGAAMDELLAIDQAIFESSQGATFEYSLFLRDGKEHTFLLSQKIITGNSGSATDQALLCVATDITDRSNMEKQLISLRLKAEEASQAKSQFLARMSHEIRTPMNVILGMSHLGLSANPDAQQRNYLTKIHSAAKNLLGIINDILDFSKIEAGEMRLETISFSLNDLLLDIETAVQTLLTGRPVVFRLSLPGIYGNLMGDPLRIRQVLLNLVNNAAKFTETGYVHLSCQIQQEHDHDYVLDFSVTDTGIGIPEEAMHRLFTSFQQVDGGTTRKYGGTGLGLAISQQFVHLMGGDIAVASTVGQGSTFAFTLTLGKAEYATDHGNSEAVGTGRPDQAGVGQEPDRRSQGAQAEELPAGPLPEAAKILVVEDNEINQEIIVELLEKHHLKVRSVNNGQEAVRAVEEDSYDLVLMDLQMPVMDGLTATKAIRALPLPRAGNVPIIALTANAMTDDQERCRQAGMNDFLSKPIDVKQLDAKLHLWLGAELQ